MSLWGSTVVGTGELLRQAWRRDRVLAPVATALFVLMAYASAYATRSLYHSGVAQLKAQQLINDQAGIVALYGPVDPSGGVGSLAMSKMTVLYALVAAGLFVALVRRHTRVEEESGRTEFLAGTSLGRNAPLLAAVVESAVLAVALGMLCGLAAIIGGLAVEGSVYFGVSWIGTGLVATGVAAVCCQLSSSARTCAVAAAGALGVLYAIRAVGDATSLHWLDWLSPFGWNTELHAWSSPRTGVILLYLVSAAGLLLAAQWLRAHRDLNGGMVAARAGAPRGAPWLGDAWALELKVHSIALGGWSLAVFLACAFFGAIMPSVNGFLKSLGDEKLTADLGGSLMVAILSEFAVIVSCFGVVVITHAAADELSGRAELVFAAAQSRTRWFAAVAGLAGAGAAGLMLLAGLGMWIGDSIGGGADAVRGVGAALVWIPAILVICGLALTTLAWRPAWTPVAWGLPFGFWVLALVPPLFHAPGWVAGLSPYDHVPKVPNAGMDWLAEGLLALAAGVIILAASRRFRVRDLG